jgi:hypothetical protein
MFISIYLLNVYVPRRSCLDTKLSIVPGLAPRVINSKKHKMRVVIGITISGALIMALALMMGISLYRKKFRTKQHLNEGQEIP